MLIDLNSGIKTLLQGKDPVIKQEGTSVSGTGIAGEAKAGKKGIVENQMTDGRTRVEFHKLREFKIQGGTVASGDNSLDFRNLSFQINEGKQLGYSEREVMNGVIKAMKPGSSLRNYCETEGADLTEDEFRELFLSYCEVKDSSTLLTQMTNSYQGDSKGGEKEK